MGQGPKDLAVRQAWPRVRCLETTRSFARPAVASLRMTGVRASSVPPPTVILRADSVPPPAVILRAGSWARARRISSCDRAKGLAVRLARRTRDARHAAKARLKTWPAKASSVVGAVFDDERCSLGVMWPSLKLRSISMNASATLAETPAPIIDWRAWS
jgi:hypothetical protein